MQIVNFQPVRTVVHRRGCGKRVGFFPSMKVGRSIAFESLLERDFIYLLEFDQNVITFCEQPLTIRYYENNREKSYIPDFAVQRLESIEIIEVKPKDKLHDEKIQKKLTAGHQYCNTAGYEYLIVTEDNINPVILNNIKALFGYSQIKVPAKIKMLVRELLDQSKVMTLNNLSVAIEARSDNACIAKSYIYNLLYCHELEVNLADPISLNSKVWLSRRRGTIV
ncbi:TnsA endonuclease N-terminal domain-containing protein [Dethiobacter alkaliphilus]|uniref:TnsA endonuclease N-terminal domain-containing protein n=1 Tax=Dethiobacter alkaliphilus TaxID=427926 RepID=UPI0022261001|nr:TnsA endonuclease N-terminal domain-containing protein [Dethiobacter alkaliphilus]MCW3491342.1 TnsA endonuclease N-terminal domain-containing protein [Dethiobacter alkaliphilus]